jgi:hypothetical protein
MDPDSEFKVPGLRFKVPGSEFKVPDSKLKILHIIINLNRFRLL